MPISCEQHTRDLASTPLAAWAHISRLGPRAELIADQSQYQPCPNGTIALNYIPGASKAPVTKSKSPLAQYAFLCFEALAAAGTHTQGCARATLIAVRSCAQLVAPDGAAALKLVQGAPARSRAQHTHTHPPGRARSPAGRTARPPPGRAACAPTASPRAAAAASGPAPRPRRPH